MSVYIYISARERIRTWLLVLARATGGAQKSKTTHRKTHQKKKLRDEGVERSLPTPHTSLSYPNQTHIFFLLKGTL